MRYDCSQVVFRAARKRRDLDTANPGRFSPAAFLLRAAEFGLSVNCQRGECAAQLAVCYGIASLHVGRIRDIAVAGTSLDVIPDEHPHALIINVPPIEDLARAELVAGRLAEISRVI